MSAESKFKLLKPSWIKHLRIGGTQRYIIYSLDFHPDMPRIATGSIDTFVKIWNISDLEGQENHGLVSTLEGHNGAVMCIKFSPCGKYLASGSDHDNLVFIWEKDENPNSFARKVFGNSEENKEPWKCTHRLSGHKLDVSDLTWSPDSAYLASSDMAGSILIWDCERNFELVKRLDKHKGGVKGICWDPAAKYLASQADDRQVIIWNTFDWTVAKIIQEHFEKSGSATMFKRLRWSPCGSQLCGVSAVDDSCLIRTASIIKRETWEEEACLAGHEMSIQCCAFHPFVFEPVNGSSKDVSTLVALGGQEGTISFWLNSWPRSPLVIEGLFNSEVNDMQWSPDGKWLAACSKDGTVALCSIFDSVPYDFDLHGTVVTAFGRMLPYSRVEELLLRFGYQPNAGKQRQTKSDIYVSASVLRMANDVENSNVLGDGDDLSPRKIMAEISTEKTLQVATSKPDGFQAPQGPINVLQIQRSTITKDGKKRLQPVLVQPGVPANTLSTVGAKTQATREIYVEAKSLNLPALPVKKMLIVDVRTGSTITRLSAENSAHPAMPVRFSYSNDKIKWHDFLFSTVLLADASEDIVIASCTDGATFAWSKSGQRLMPSFVLDDQINQVQVRNNMVFLITKSGFLWLLDVHSKKVLFQRLPLSPILNAGEEATFSLSSVTVSESGAPLVTLGDHRVFIYNPKLSIWQRVGAADTKMKDILEIYSGGCFSNVRPPRDPFNIQSQDQRSAIMKQCLSKLSSKVSSDVVKMAVLSDLEEKLSLSISQKLTETTKNLLISYAARLGEMDSSVSSRVESLLNTMTTSSTLDEVLIEENKQDLLQQMLPLLSRNSQIQSLLDAYISRSSFMMAGIEFGA